jgi:hypothetical protein
MSSEPTFLAFGEEIEFSYCYVEDYQCSGPAFGYWDCEVQAYRFGDGDSYKPDRIAGTGIHFFEEHLLISLLEPHFRNQKGPDQKAETND